MLVEAAVAQAIDRVGRLVTTDEVIAALIVLYGTRELVGAGRLQRVLEPALAEGRVTITPGEHGVYYGLASRPGLRVPGIAEASDLAKVEEALRRAVRAVGGAVDLDTVEAVVEADPDLILASAERAVSYHLAVLARVRRAVTVRPWHGAARARYYYTVPGGPTRIPDRVVTHMDRRRRAAAALWRAGGERPFTTAALRRFARNSPRYRTGDDDPPYAWTNALQLLERNGEYTAIRDVDGRWVRWAPADAWATLDEAERSRRLRDEYRAVAADTGEGTEEDADDRSGYDPPDDALDDVRGDAADASGAGPPAGVKGGGLLTPDAPGHDVAFVSGNWNLRTVITLARQVAVERAPSDESDVARRRPVTLDQVRPVADRCPHLLGGAADPKRLLHQASRPRRPGGRAAVTRVGVVGRTTYYDLEPSEAGMALVEFFNRRREADADRAEAALHRLDERVEFALGGLDPLPEAATAAWATVLRDDAAGRADALETATARGERAEVLFREEREDAERCISALRDVAARAEAVRRTAADAGEWDVGAPASVQEVGGGEGATWLLIDMADAWAQVADAAHFDLASPRLLQTRIKHLVPTVRRAPAPPTTSRGGRRVEVFLDRPAFAAYAAIRWAGPHWASLASHGLATLGAVRDPAVFARCLEEDADPRHHAGAAAALALLDDQASRAALAAYLLRRAVAEERGAPLTPTGALASAALGLAPKPAGGLAVELGDDERAALARTAATRQGDYAGRCARLTLAAWDEGWPRERLTRL